MRVPLNRIVHYIYKIMPVVCDVLIFIIFLRLDFILIDLLRNRILTRVEE
jgi:hypothetical protein